MSEPTKPKASIINGKATFSISIVALAIALLGGGVNLGIQYERTQSNKEAIVCERSERMASQQQLQQQTVAAINRLTSRIDRLVEDRK